MLQFDIYDMIFSVVNFLVLVFILKKFLYKPVLNVLDSRKEEIQNKYQQAEEAHNEALRLKEEYTEELKKAKAEAREIVDQAGKQGENAKAEIIAEARESANKITKKAQEEVKLEQEMAKTELRDTIATVAIKAAEKILGKTIQPEDQIRLTREFISDFTEKDAYNSVAAEGRVVEAEVRSAVALNPEELKNLEEKLAKAAGHKVRLVNIIEPDMIGGLVVRMGDAIIDGSVTTQLSLLGEHLQKEQIAEPEVEK